MEKRINIRWIDTLWPLFLGLLLSIALKVWLISSGSVPFNADEAIVALMGRHILSGIVPVFFYGQAYLGSLDPLLVAAGFAVFGQAVWVIRLVQALLYLGVLGTTAWLGALAFDSWKTGALAALLLSIPTVNLTLYTTASLGGYGEALLIGNLVLILTLRISARLDRREDLGVHMDWLLLGFLAGLGVWAFGLTLVFSAPAAIFLLVKLTRGALQSRRAALVKEQTLESDEAATAESISQADQSNQVELSAILLRIGKALLLAFLGVALGSLPYWGYAARYGLNQLVYELGGGVISGVEGLHWLPRLWQHLVSLILLGGTVTLGLRPPWDVIWLALPLIPFVLVFWMVALAYMLRSLRPQAPYTGASWLLFGVILTLVVGFLFSSFGADPSGRYFTPLSVPMALFAAGLVLLVQERIGAWTYAMLFLVLFFNLWGTVQSAAKMPPGITTQFYPPAQVDHRQMEELIDFLRNNGEYYGYSNYWVSYPLAFTSGEELIYVPRLPYHPDFRYSERDDRYPPYDEMVNAAERVAYITTNHSELDALLRSEFTRINVGWQETKIGDYQIFYALSEPVQPEQIGLGRTTP